jgi:uncharacterized protein (TIGR02301 family)
MLSARALAGSMLAIVIASTVLPGCSLAQPGQKHQPVSKPVLPPPQPPATPAPPPETRPYDAQLMRLAEILGGLTYLRDLCGPKDADQWRARMQALLDAEGSSAVRKDRLAGAFNRGLEGYSLSYRACTPNAHIVIERFLSEGERIAKAVENRYRAS